MKEIDVLYKGVDLWGEIRASSMVEPTMGMYVRIITGR